MKTLALIVVCWIAFTSGNVTAEQRWSQFGGELGNFSFNDSKFQASHIPTKRWQRTLGEGMSSIVAQDNALFTSYLVSPQSSSVSGDQEERDKSPAGDSQGSSKKTIREAVISMDIRDGRTLWKHEYDADWLEEQQAFGGRARAPQATPALCGKYVVSIGFTGIVHCLDSVSGELIWTKQAVKSLKAPPVQFGFSASPISIGPDQVCLLLGGKSGLVCCSVATGKTVWQHPCGESSYATPVLWKRPDGRQIVYVTREQIVGLNAETGKQLWNYTLPETGLTNVPTPMVLDDSDLLISGQGVKGTRRLSITTRQDEYSVAEVWKSDEQFFYCNSIRVDDTLWSCDGELLLSLDLKTGDRLGRFRGFANSNLLLGKKHIISFDGEGHLSVLRREAHALQVLNRYAVLNKRCWTPPTPQGQFLVCRGGDQVLCLDMAGGDPRASVAQTRVRKNRLTLSTLMPKNTNNSPQEQVDPLEQIVKAFESEGKQAAWKRYNEIRSEDPDAIELESRLALAKMAKQQSLTDFAAEILRHAKEDFPKEAKEHFRQPAKEMSTGTNGLVYVEFSLLNTQRETLQCTVKGPPKHPFGYGLPLRTDRQRVEKWPLGTKLYHLGSLLLTVSENMAGKTIKLPTATK